MLKKNLSENIFNKPKLHFFFELWNNVVDGPQWLRIVKCLSSCNENAIFTHRPYLLFAIVSIISWLESSKRSSLCIRFAGLADKKLLELLPSASWVYFCRHNARLYERRVYYSLFESPIVIAVHVENTNLDSVSHARSERFLTFELEFNCTAPCSRWRREKKHWHLGKSIPDTWRSKISMTRVMWFLVPLCDTSLFLR